METVQADRTPQPHLPRQDQHEASLNGGPVSLHQIDSNQPAAPQSRNTHHQSIETTPDELLNAKRQTELLTIICRELTRPPNKTEFISNAILQLVALVIGVLFGVFSILAYSITQTANKLSLAANQIALLSLCLSSNSVGISVPLICHVIRKLTTMSEYYG
jgi:hypothetical protein